MSSLSRVWQQHFRFAAWCLIGAVTLTGCAITSYLRVADPVGPKPGSVQRENGGMGTLVVYSETEEIDRGDSGSSVLHSAYSIYDLHDKLLRRIRNHADDEDESAQIVSLAPGTYVVRARGLGEWLEVVARVEANRTTEIHFDRDWSPAATTNRNILAHAADGTAIGWHARAGSILGLEGELRYEGSSTIAAFVREAQSVFGRASISIDDRGESGAGEVAVLGTADLGGVARELLTPPANMTCEIIGYDAVVAIVRADSPLTGLTRAQLADIFTGRILNWAEVGGPDRSITPLIVAAGSATRSVFRKAVLRGDEYRAIVASPDRDIVDRVGRSGAMIGQISKTFIRPGDNVRILTIDHQEPTPDNPNYPILRPLNLCIREQAPELARNFLEWTLSDPGQEVVRRRFTGAQPR